MPKLTLAQPDFTSNEFTAKTNPSEQDLLLYSLKADVARDTLRCNNYVRRNPHKIKSLIVKFLELRCRNVGSVDIGDCSVSWKRSFLPLHLEFQLEFHNLRISTRYLAYVRDLKTDYPVRIINTPPKLHNTHIRRFFTLMSL